VGGGKSFLTIPDKILNLRPAQVQIEIVDIIIHFGVPVQEQKVRSGSGPPEGQFWESAAHTVRPFTEPLEHNFHAGL
jgi:hypothetical protein